MSALHINNMSVEEKMELAYRSKDSNILSKLANDTNAGVRRIVAKSHCATKEILDALALDPVMNVSFMAYQNPLSNIQREFSDIDHPCVVCTNDERVDQCLNCKSLKNHYNSSYE